MPARAFSPFPQQPHCGCCPRMMGIAWISQLRIYSITLTAFLRSCPLALCAKAATGREALGVLCSLDITAYSCCVSATFCCQGLCLDGRKRPFLLLC
jgi:hypothetical protein